MKSKWYELKGMAIQLRKRGTTLTAIHDRLGMPMSTLSGWLRFVDIPDNAKDILQKKRDQVLVEARAKAALWHREDKQLRIQKEKEYARNFIQRIDLEDLSILELSLAILYLGEGFKKVDTTGMGSSDPMILKYFLYCLKTLYSIPDPDIRISLYLRSDQDIDLLKAYWCKELDLPLSCFKDAYKDKRTQGSKTYAGYMGVCAIRCGRVDIQRRLVYIGTEYCKEVVKAGDKLVRSLGN